jgi:lysozyme family protein
MAIFELALALTLSHEGGWSDHPLDKGGATNKGITLSTLKAVNPNADKWALYNISEDLVEKIYRNNYWDNLRLDEVQDQGTATVIFDQAVNTGPDKAIRSLQTVLGVEVDGKMGPNTLGALNSFKSDQLKWKLICVYQDHYINIVKSNLTQIAFLSGWIKRTQTYYFL